MIGNIFPTQSQCKLCRESPPNKILNERRIEIPMGSQALYSFIGKSNIENANHPPIQSSGDRWHISSYDSPKLNKIPCRNRKKRARIFDTPVPKPLKAEIKQIIQPSADLSHQVRLLKLQIKQYQRHERLFAENERLLKSCNHSMSHQNEQLEHLSRENKRLLSVRHSPNKQQIDDKFQQLLTPFAINDDSFEVNQFRYSSNKFHPTPKTVEPSPAQKVVTFMKADIPRIEEKHYELKLPIKLPIKLQSELDQPICRIKMLNRKLQLQCAALQSRNIQNVNPLKFLEHIDGDTGFLY